MSHSRNPFDPALRVSSPKGISWWTLCFLGRSVLSPHDVDALTSGKIVQSSGIFPPPFNGTYAEDRKVETEGTPHPAEPEPWCGHGEEHG